MLEGVWGFIGGIVTDLRGLWNKYKPRREIDDTDPNAQFKAWHEQWEVIFTDVQGLLINRELFREVQAIIRANPNIQQGSSFYEWMGNVYATAAVIGVRRQLDSDSRSISLLRLFEDILKNPRVLSRERYIALYRNLPAEFGHRDFDRFAGQGGDYVDSTAVKTDMSMLKQKAAGLKKFANKRIAHFDRSPYKNLPTYDELDKCLDYLEELLKKALYQQSCHQPQSKHGGT